MTGKAKLTDEVEESICSMIRAGHHCKTSAIANDVAESTYHLWKSKGAKAKTGQYRQFYEAVEKAIAESEKILVETVLLGGPKFALEILKRRFPEHWGDRHRFEHSGPKGGPLRTENEHSGEVGPLVQVVVAGTDSTWDPALHGAVEEAGEDDVIDPD
jgi:hypothetical protein